MNEPSYIDDWSQVPADRFEQAQKTERDWWTARDSALLTLQAQYYFYAGYYQWTKNRGLLNPFRVDSSRPHNFQLPPQEMEGAILLDVGCGPASWTLSLVHCATVHVVDPLVRHYQQLQPFGWEFFNSVVASRAEDLPVPTESVDIVHSRNALDHTQNADRVLSEIARVLKPRGQLLLDCHLRGERGGGWAHPYKWHRKVFEERVFARFDPVTPPVLIDEAQQPIANEGEAGVPTWVCRLRKNGLSRSGYP